MCVLKWENDSLLEFENKYPLDKADDTCIVKTCIQIKMHTIICLFLNYDWKVASVPQNSVAKNESKKSHFSIINSTSSSTNWSSKNNC